MAEYVYYSEVRCVVEEGGLYPDGVTARLVDADGRSEFVQLTRGMINTEDGTDYLPIGIVTVDRSRRRVLIELPAEADSGANRLWVDFGSLRHEEARDAEPVA